VHISAPSTKYCFAFLSSIEKEEVPDDEGVIASTRGRVRSPELKLNFTATSP
jgi:hypothetical protein